MAPGILVTATAHASYKQNSLGRMVEVATVAHLHVVKDSAGSVTLGWVAPRVYYACFAGRLSTELGRTQVAHLEAALAEVTTLAYFSDASAMSSYDLLARSAYVRLILEHRRKFSSLTMLTWAGGATASTEAFAAAIGGAVRILRDQVEFEKLLSTAAPRAFHVTGMARGTT